MELWPTESPSRLSRLFVALGILLVATCSLAWWVRALVGRFLIYGARSVALLGALEIPSYGWALVGAGVALVVLLLLRRPELVRPRTLSLFVFAFLITAIASVLVPYGWHLAIAGVSILIALVVGLLLPDRVMERRAMPSDRRIAIALYAATTIVFCVFSMHRHFWFGSGSWDMGCMLHNVYRASRLLDSTSTVLGNVDYLGDHFMIGIYLYAPFFWLWSSGYTLLFIQSASLAATAPAIFLIARTRAVDPISAIVIALATAFGFGMQSAAYFDCHEIALGIGFLAFALYALESKRLGWATVFLAAFALFKESLGAYVVALGLFGIARGLMNNDRRLMKYGALWMLGGTLWFVLVNRVFMPALIARANAPEPHETFADFGPTVFEAAKGIATHPLKAIGALFVPEEKLWSLAVTFGGLGYLAFFSPSVAIAALPLLAERFLSSKTTMWEMGYHYAAPLTIYAGWATAIGWPRALAFAKRALAYLGPGLERRAPLVLLVFLVSQVEIVNTIGYRHPSNFHHWMDDYFSEPARRDANQAAVDFLADRGRDQKIAVQNRILPHLADRPYCYRLGDWSMADWVLLSVGESAWPYDDGLPQRVANELFHNPEWRLVFSENQTAVFARVRVAEAVAPVVPSALLALALHGAK
jgi:uncharacterized membrane protein